MIKIFFTCFWQTDLLDLLKKNTPNNKTIWKNKIIHFKFQQFNHEKNIRSGKSFDIKST